MSGYRRYKKVRKINTSRGIIQYGISLPNDIAQKFSGINLSISCGAESIVLKSGAGIIE